MDIAHDHARPRSGWFPWRHARPAKAHPALQAPIIMMSQNRAAARDEVLAQHHYEETQKIDSLLQANTALTRQVHDLTEKVHLLTQRLCGETE
jgi:uncharacterized membrane protein